MARLLGCKISQIRLCRARLSAATALERCRNRVVLSPEYDPLCASGLRRIASAVKATIGAATAGDVSPGSPRKRVLSLPWPQTGPTLVSTGHPDGHQGQAKPLVTVRQTIVVRGLPLRLTR